MRIEASGDCRTFGTTAREACVGIASSLEALIEWNAHALTACGLHRRRNYCPATGPNFAGEDNGLPLSTMYVPMIVRLDGPSVAPVVSDAGRNEEHL